MYLMPHVTTMRCTRSQFKGRHVQCQKDNILFSLNTMFGDDFSDESMVCYRLHKPEAALLQKPDEGWTELSVKDLLERKAIDLQAAEDWRKKERTENASGTLVGEPACPLIVEHDFNYNRCLESV